MKLERPGSTRRSAALLGHLHRDAPLHAFVAAYWVAGFLMGLWAGVPEKFVPFTYLTYRAPQIALDAVIIVGAWSLLSRSPFSRIRLACATIVEPQALAGLLLVVALFIHMGVFTSVKTMLTDVHPFFADAALADLDEWIHGSAPSSYTMQWLSLEATRVLARVYFGCWGLLMVSCLLACVFVPRLRGVRDQYLWTHLLIWPLLGNVVALAFMSAGPLFYERVMHDPQRFAGLSAYLASALPDMTGRQYLWEAYVTGRPVPAAGISAFPSLHLANATLFALLARRMDRRLGWAGAVFVCAILFGSVHLGWHYAVDGYASISATILAWWTVGHMQRWHAATQPRSRPAPSAHEPTRFVTSGATCAGASSPTILVETGPRRHVPDDLGTASSRVY